MSRKWLRLPQDHTNSHIRRMTHESHKRKCKKKRGIDEGTVLNDWSTREFWKFENSTNEFTNHEINQQITRGKCFASEIIGENQAKLESVKQNMRQRLCRVAETENISMKPLHAIIDFDKNLFIFRNDYSIWGLFTLGSWDWSIMTWKSYLNYN